MFSQGIRLEIRIGKNVPEAVPLLFAESVQEVEVTHSEEGRSGFQITLQGGRYGPGSLQNYPLLESDLLKPFNRVVMIVTIRSSPQILMDGIITRHQLLPDEQNEESGIVVTGEDVGVMMDLKEKSVEHSGMDDATIAKRILSGSDYSQYGLVPKVSNPPVIDVPHVNERTPVQQLSDLEYLKEMAGRYGYVFYITPGPTQGQNTAYWGPPQQEGNPQEPLSVNMGPYTNAERINFQYDGLTPTAVTGSLQDRSSNEVNTLGSSTKSPASSRKGAKEQPYVRQRKHREPGLNTAQAAGRIQGRADSSSSKAATAEGELDAVRYGGLLWPHRPVTVRGAGKSHDGIWNVKSVTHLLQRGEYYKQRFTLGRESMGATV